MSSVNKHGKLYLRRSAHCEDRFDCRSDRSARVYNVVNQDNLFIRDFKLIVFGVIDRSITLLGQVITIKMYIQGLERDVNALNLHDVVVNHLSEVDSPALDSDKHNILGSLVFLDYFV